MVEIFFVVFQRQGQEKNTASAGVDGRGSVAMNSSDVSNLHLSLTPRSSAVLLFFFREI